MKSSHVITVLAASAATVLAQTPSEVVSLTAFADGPTLPAITVFSPRVANQAPAGTFTMPVSALRFEPRVDVEARNLAEGQADVTIRGGIFENTGFRLGAVTVLDPQTGHYFADLPVTPFMLGAPRILTGAAVATGTTNATTGAIAYPWRPIRTAGALALGAGPHELWRGELYQGAERAVRAGGTFGADVSVAHSESNGAIAFGDHHFDRVNARLQYTTPTSQTDLFAGYQAKFFGWPNLYTPFNSDETENLQNTLFVLNHRRDLGGGDFVTAGAYHRRNKDDYAFNRFASVGAVHPFQHTTWQDGLAAEIRRGVGELTLDARAEFEADYLESTSLRTGPYQSRTLAKFSLVPEKSWAMASGGDVTVKAGATYDDTNRGRGWVSPVAELARTFGGSSPLRRVYASYSVATQEPSYTALKSSPTSGLFRGNAGLGREVARNAEIGASGTVAGWTVEAAAFARRDDALVDWTFVRTAFARTANAVDIDTAGFEAVVRRAWSRAEVTVGYTALTKDPNYRGAAVDASFYALNYARQRLTAAATLRLGAGFELRLDNVARIQASNFLRTVGGNRTVQSTAALAYHPAALHGLELTFELENVWNSRFQEVPAVPATPRLWSVGATYVW